MAENENPNNPAQENELTSGSITRSSAPRTRRDRRNVAHTNAAGTLDNAGLLKILEASIKRVPANMYALGVLGVVAAAVLALRMASGSAILTVGGGIAMLAAMVLLRIFAKPAEPTTPYSSQAITLTWICLVAFVVVLSLFVAKLYASLFPSSSSTDAALRPVPVTIKSVRRGTLTPISNTIFTVKTSDGKYIKQELPPNPSGSVEVPLLPGRYLLSAIGANTDLPFEVTAPITTITIQISDSGQLTGISPDMKSGVGPQPKDHSFLGPLLDVEPKNIAYYGETDPDYDDADAIRFKRFKVTFDLRSVGGSTAVNTKYNTTCKWFNYNTDKLPLAPDPRWLAYSRPMSLRPGDPESIEDGADNPVKMSEDVEHETVLCFVTVEYEDMNKGGHGQQFALEPPGVPETRRTPVAKVAEDFAARLKIAPRY